MSLRVTLESLSKRLRAFAADMLRVADECDHVVAWLGGGKP